MKNLWFEALHTLPLVVLPGGVDSRKAQQKVLYMGAQHNQMVYYGKARVQDLTFTMSTAKEIETVTTISPMITC